MAAVRVMEPTAALPTDWAVSQAAPPSLGSRRNVGARGIEHTHRHRRRTAKAGQRIDAGELLAGSRRAGCR